MRFPNQSIARDGGTAPAPSMPPAAPPHPGAPPTERFDPRQYLHVVLSRWWIVLLAFLAAVAAGVAYSVLATPIYRAVCRFEVFQESRLNIGRTVSPLDRLSRHLGRHIVIMESLTLRNHVLAKLHGKWAETIPEEYRVPEISIKPVSEAAGTMLDIKVDGVDGDYCLAFLNELLTGYQEQRRAEVVATDESAIRSLRQEQERLARELEEADTVLIRFQQEHNIQFSRAKEAMDQQFLASLVQRENALRMERTILESQAPLLENADTATIQDALALTLETHDATIAKAGLPVVPSQESDGDRTGGIIVAQSAPSSLSDSARNNAWQEQEALVVRLQAEYQDKLRTYRPGHPDMIALQQKIRDAERELKIAADIARRRLRSRHDALKLQEQALEEAAKSWRQEIKLTAAERATYASLLSKAAHLKRLHDEVYTRILDSVARNVDPHYSRLVEEPRVLEDPVWPSRLKIIGAALVFGLGLGVGLAFVLDYLDTSHVDVLAIEQALGIEFLGAVPDWARIIKGFDPAQSHLVVDRDRDSRATETYRALRTSLETRLTAANHGYALLVTSAEPEEGKTFTAANLAQAFAWTGKRVLLIDGDLRRGRLHRCFDVQTEPGLTDLLIGKAGDWRRVLRTDVAEGLSLITAGKFNATAPEMLSVGGMSRLLQELRDEYELIVIDAAPVGHVADSQLLARVCDGILLVARQGIVNMGTLRNALRRLDPGKIAGFCLNAVDFSSRRYGYYGRHGYYGGYGQAAYYGGYYAYQAQPDDQAQND